MSEMAIFFLSDRKDLSTVTLLFKEKPCSLASLGVISHLTSDPRAAPGSLGTCASAVPSRPHPPWLCVCASVCLSACPSLSLSLTLLLLLLLLSSSFPLICPLPTPPPFSSTSRTCPRLEALPRAPPVSRAPGTRGQPRWQQPRQDAATPQLHGRAAAPAGSLGAPTHASFWKPASSEKPP